MELPMRSLIIALIFCFGSIANGSPDNVTVEQSAKKPLTYLNHFVVVVDWDTANSIDKSVFLKTELSGFSKMVGGYNKGAAYYFWGENTYLEVFDPDGHPVADAKFSFGLGVDEKGELAKLDSIIAHEFQPQELTSVGTLMPYDDVRPWFWFTEFNLSARVYLWIMEFHENYLSPTDVSRKADLQAQYEPNKLLKDITGISANVTDPEFDFIERLFKLLDYQATPQPGFTRFLGPDLQVDLYRGSSSSVRHIDFSLNQIKSGETDYQLGPKASLVFSKSQKTARWSF